MSAAKVARKLPWAAPGWLAAGWLALAGCLGGNGTETETLSLSGRAAYPDGSPAPGARLRLRPAAYLPGGPDTAGSRDARAGDDGSFRLGGLEPGPYALEIDDGRGRACLLRNSQVTGEVRLPGTPLQPAGAVSGRVGLPAGAAGALIEVYGLEARARVGADGAFLLGDLPPGEYTLRVLAATAAADPLDLPRVAVRAADTTALGTIAVSDAGAAEDYASWPHSRTLAVNAAGAGLSAPLADFPLLVRIDSAHFAFSPGDSAALRFARAGRHLAYQVEQWDPAGRHAAIWVRVDTIFPGRDGQALTLYWGRAGAPSRSDGAAVFGRSAGFAAAWHLGEEAPDTTTLGLYRNASEDSNHGDDHISDTGRDGVAGWGHRFAAGDYIEVPRVTPILEPKGGVTLSAWVRGDGSGDLGGEIASMGDQYGLRLVADGSAMAWSMYDSSLDWATCHAGSGLYGSGWHHVAAVWGPDSLRMFVDGAERGDTVLVHGIGYRLTPNFRMGRHANGRRDFDFTGALDEVEVSLVPRTADWLRFAYASQAPGSRVVAWP